MKKSETAELLAIAAAVDPRVAMTGPAVEVWHDAIGHLDAGVARGALRLHHRESTDVPLPAHILRQAEHSRELIDLELSREAQRDWLDTLGLTMADYTENWDEPGWLDDQQRRFDSLKALGRRFDPKQVEQ